MNEKVDLSPVDGVEVTVVMDNAIDILAAPTETALRPPWQWDWSDVEQLRAECAHVAETEVDPLASERVDGMGGIADQHQALDVCVVPVDLGGHLCQPPIDLLNRDQWTKTKTHQDAPGSLGSIGLLESLIVQVGSKPTDR